MCKEKSIERVSTQLTSWKPTVDEMEKIKELQKKLIIPGNTAIVIKAIGELYEREVGKKWA